MKKTKKQILGIAGLAAVGVMTAVAYGMPVPGAAAKEADTEVHVVVSEGTPSSVIASPSDGSETAKGTIEVVTNYSQAKRLEFFLSYKDASGSTVRVDLPSYTPTADAGTYKFSLDVTPYGFGEYELHTLVVGYDGVTRETDAVSFSYRAAVVEPETGKTEGGDPTIGVEISDDTEKVIVTIFDKDGNPVTGKDGKPVEIELDRSDIDPSTGKILVDLPFEELGIPAGDYTAVVSAYDKDGKLISVSHVGFGYTPVTPDTPNTGMLSIGDLNISRIDYLVTGLIAFAVAAGFAVALVYRRSRR